MFHVNHFRLPFVVKSYILDMRVPRNIPLAALAPERAHGEIANHEERERFAKLTPGSRTHPHQAEA